MRDLVFVHVIEEVAHDRAQNAPLIKNWARSCVQAAERDLLVACPVINIRGKWGNHQKTFLSNS